MSGPFDREVLRGLAEGRNSWLGVHASATRLTAFSPAAARAAHWAAWRGSVPDRRIDCSSPWAIFGDARARAPLAAFLLQSQESAS